MLASAATASGATITDRPLLFRFDGADTTAGAFANPWKIAIDDSSGVVYVSENPEFAGGREAVDKFHPDGSAWSFEASGSSSLSGGVDNPFDGRLGVAVDNSGGPNQSRLHVSQRLGKATSAFAPSGSLLWKIPSSSYGFQPQDVAVDHSGHVWIAPGGELGSLTVKEYANTGAPPAPIGSLPVPSVAGIDFDASENAYIVLGNSNGGIGNAGDVVKFSGGAKGPTIDSGAVDVYADQSGAGGHIFTAHREGFNEYDSKGAAIGSFGASAVLAGEGIAYSKALDRVYVVDHGMNVVDAFGPPVTGTVPDPTIAATDEIKVGQATLHGSVNPQGVSNSYHFEYAPKGFFGDWREVSESTPQSLPEDSASHAVSFHPTNLRGNTTYQVRLVGVNSANGLRLASGLSEFKTQQVAAPPPLTIDEPSAIASASAKVTGTINPLEDFVSWRVQKSTDPACAEDFSDEATQTLPGEARNVPVPVEYTMNGLLPAQHYCVRIVATNSLGSTISEVRELTTKADPPSEAEIASAAPRTDTTARLNARVNPEGEATLTYHFEYEEEGSGEWISLPDRQYVGSARRRVPIGQEVGGLTPNTVYRYRLAKAVNEAGSAPSLGADRTFATRTIAEATPPQRGIELVSNPDKGNQNALAVGPFNGTPTTTGDGEKVLWTVLGGAPGANSGSQAAFLAERTPSGWRSQSLLPPADGQVGKGFFVYRVEAATPDFSRFLFQVAKSDVFLTGSRTIVRLDVDHHQDVLTSYDKNLSESLGLAADLTDDGAQVLAINSDTDQLEEIGAGAPEVVSLTPGGTPFSCGLSHEGESFMGPAPRAAGRSWRPGYHRIATTDASRVYFEAHANGDCGGRYRLYVRNREAEETRQIDPGVLEKSPELIRVAPDGRSAYFVTFSKLDPIDGNEDADVYRWDEGEGVSTCVTCEADPDVSIAQFGGPVVTLVSDDFSHVYFVSKKQLTPEAMPGTSNVYALSAGQIHFVATTLGDQSDAANVDPLNGESQALISADGNVLTFVSQGGLTADAVASQCLKTGELNPGIGACRELYRYDDRDGSLECLSCAHGVLTTHSAGSTFYGPQPVHFKMSADGSTIAFATAERLVALDVNNDIDIYEWRDGSLRLITDGLTDFQTGFAAPQVSGVDADGSDILFSVVEPGLTGFERDRLANVYDARVGGGFVPPAPPAHCSEDSCQGPLSAPPSVGEPASAGFAGRGNVVEARLRCRKGKVRRRGRCVKGRHRKHHKRAGHVRGGGAG
jgi:hypothetical protein